MRLRKLKERLNIFVVQQPGRAILIGILLLNVIWFILAALVISALAPSTLADKGFWASIFYTITMILDAGCISFVIEDIGQASVGLIFACLIIVLVGMITFTGAVIGYVTNMISKFIENSNSENQVLKISGHTVILNWNSRASEIINDLLYTGEREAVVVLVNDGAAAVKQEISDRLADTVRREGIKNQLSIIVREGDTVSSKRLADISLLTAKNVIILEKDLQNFACKYDYSERKEKLEHGNANTIKTLVQVAEITSSNESADNQIIIVEVEDNWTLDLVRKVIAHKENLGKCNIVPVPVNQILGQILSQFSIMPRLNSVYSELFSNRGAEFFCVDHATIDDEDAAIAAYLENHMDAIPLTTMMTKSGPQAFYVADAETDIGKTAHTSVPKLPEGSFHVNSNFWLEQRNVIIIGHNSNCDEIMRGFNSFREEWNFSDGREILNIMIIDDKNSLEKHNYYKDYPYVNKCVEAEVFDSDIITDAINTFFNDTMGDVSILILSDNNAYTEDTDANALTYLIYVQDFLTKKAKTDPYFEPSRVDLIVEILDPKNYDVAYNFNANNVVISNRYISKMVTQISEKVPLFEFYQDILVYDTFGGIKESDDKVYESRELYIKKVERFLPKFPTECTAAQLIRGVFDASPEGNKAIVLGYVDRSDTIHIFSGDQNDIAIRLTPKDRLIIYSNH